MVLAADERPGAFVETLFDRGPSFYQNFYGRMVESPCPESGPSIMKSLEIKSAFGPVLRQRSGHKSKAGLNGLRCELAAFPITIGNTAHSCLRTSPKADPPPVTQKGAQAVENIFV